LFNLHHLILVQIDGGSATEEEKHYLFSIYPVSNINKNTFYRITPLQLDQGQTYYVWVMGKYWTCPWYKHNFLFKFFIDCL